MMLGRCPVIRRVLEGQKGRATSDQFQPRSDPDQRMTADPSPLLHGLEKETRRGSIIRCHQPAVGQNGCELIGKDPPNDLNRTW